MPFSSSLQALRGMRSHCGGDVNVEVNTAPGHDLKKRLDQLRCEYETIIDQNRREVECWYESKVNGAYLCPTFATQLYGRHNRQAPSAMTTVQVPSGTQGQQSRESIEI